MSNRKVYCIKPTTEERNTFAQVAKGKRGKFKIAAWKVKRANAMLKRDESEQGSVWSNEKIAEAFGTTMRSLEKWGKQAALHGLLGLLERKQRATPPTPRLLDGEKQAQLTKIACSTPPGGFEKPVRAMAQIDVVHSAGAGCGVCCCHETGFDRVFRQGVTMHCACVRQLSKGSSQILHHFRGVAAGKKLSLLMPDGRKPPDQIGLRIDDDKEQPKAKRRRRRKRVPTTRKKPKHKPS